MQQKFMLMIAVVFVITMIFGILIWWQLGRIQKRALEAKRKKEAYLEEMSKKQEELNQVLAMQEENETEEKTDEIEEKSL